MEAVAPGRHHDYLCHQPSSVKPHLYGPSDYHKQILRNLHGSSCGFVHAEVDSCPADGNGCKESISTWSPSFSKSFDCEGKKSYSNGEGGTNGYHLDGAHENLEICESVIQAQLQTCMERCDSCVVAEPDEDLCDNSYRSEVPDEGIDGVQDTKSVENTVEKLVARLHVPESTEILDFDVSQCYSPDEWSSRASTDSSLSTASASPAWPSPVFNRCKTSPIGASIIWDENEHAPNLSRSKTDKEKKQKLSEALYQMPSREEKLSERKRKKIIENLVRIKNDGTVEVDVDRGNEIAPTLFELVEANHLATNIEEECKEPIKSMPSYLEIAMLIVGTRGDVQPFVAIGKRLRERGHRVRLATHANFRGFVTSNGLEFYPLGGDPKILAGYMVKNKGFLPSGPSEISMQKKQLKAIMNSLLPACTKADGSGAPFNADAIIANPPAYGHVHVAEYLDVPLHIFFTMPWTPTNEFPHPLARVKQQAGYRMSYHVGDSLMWWGMRGLINEFRVKELKLNPMNYFNWNQGSISHLPTGYMWSPHLVPKPKDWGQRVDVVGFCFLSLANNYEPPDALVKWLATGEKPIYVGFGSLPVENPGKMTEIIVQALRETKQRGIIDKGWGGLGNLEETPDSIFLLENCPHDWLFPQCAAVVHHGGAGTTAAGLKAGCPTTVIPFFGDQPFWGERVCSKGVGPLPIPVRLFSLERLVQAINFMQDPEVKRRALELAMQMQEEDGVEVAVDAFYRHWVRRPPKPSTTTEALSFYQTFLIWLRRLWCLPWCFE
ncbi:hypothetical protein GOP47_0024317 [Adiantum capillus-veneris]|uniref:Glycosyltransferase family 28 N-terminal domain-containing protein n=1 Tax=Adiantum capillus-veneris TaxID=13818 RepID=A0A9D4U220_ADICA|nr:hypothetical protein GOP47_0024317 [Adiantum capillus-veneris]